MPSMYAEDDEFGEAFTRCADIRCTRSPGHSSRYISEGYVQYSQPSLNGMVELYQTGPSININMCT